MQTQDVAETLVGRVEKFEDEVKRVKIAGHVVQVVPFREEPKVRGVELKVDLRVSSTKIRHIVHYIVNTYNLDAYFYTKNHAIKVWYRDAK
jgi:Tfp pilus assembly protein PilZ